MEQLTIENAPVVQLLLTVSFTQPMNLTMVDMVEVFGLFRDEYPVFQQIDRAGPMSADPALTIEIMGSPRVHFATEDLSGMILFQNDRLSVGWNRPSPLGDTPSYPGYAATFNKFEEHLRTLREWAGRREVDLQPLVGEVSYTDAFDLMHVEGLGEGVTCFRFFDPGFDYRVNTFNFSWVEPLGGEREGFVQGIINSPTLSPAGVQVATLQTTSRFNVQGDWARLSDGFSEAHQAIHRVFSRVVNPAAWTKS